MKPYFLIHFMLWLHRKSPLEFSKTYAAHFLAKVKTEDYCEKKKLWKLVDVS